MPSGLRQDVDLWLREYEEAKALASDILAMVQVDPVSELKGNSVLQERNMKHPNGGQEASRVTAAARRKLGSLGSALDNLRDMLDGPQCADATENEKTRRRDQVANLRLQREQVLQSLKRDSNSAKRAALLEPAAPGGGSSAPGRETLRTAELDNRGLVQLQQTVMREQDAELEELERSVTSTKHIALTVNEELGLQARLLDELDEDVDVSHSRLRAAQKRLKHVLATSGNCRSLCITIGLMCILAVVILIGFKLF